MVLDQGRIVGVDEVGRGCLFGPVFAGAVSLTKDSEAFLVKAGLADSKKLTARKRGKLVPLIKENCQDWSLGQASAKEIDLIGIRKATEYAMLRALQKLRCEIKLTLVDGVLPIRIWEGPQITLIKGDEYHPSISAASVLAKEARDALIRRLAIKYPNYQLEKNVGYGTKVHRENLIAHGASPLHRQSFLSKIIF